MTTEKPLPRWIAERLSRSLPGPAAHARFAPELNYGRHQIPPFPDSRRAAVLILVYPSHNQWCLPLTVRPATMSAHAGQVSFPGGEIDVGETVEQAALREYEEELGLAPEETMIVGRLTPLYVYASSYLVTPCVAISPRRPDFQANPVEVADVLEVPIEILNDSSNYGTHWIRRQRIQFRAPHIRFQDQRIWGATSMMLAEFLEFWSEMPPDLGRPA